MTVWKEHLWTKKGCKFFQSSLTLILRKKRISQGFAGAKENESYLSQNRNPFYVDFDMLKLREKLCTLIYKRWLATKAIRIQKYSKFNKLILTNFNRFYNNYK